MATKEFPLTPLDVAQVKTNYRCIQTAIPVLESVRVLEQMRRAEPRSMGGQPPILWHHGDRCTVSDPWGNRWIDLCAGVLVTASGHSHPRIVDAIKQMAEQGAIAHPEKPAEFEAFVKAETAKWGPVVKQSGARVD